MWTVRRMDRRRHDEANIRFPQICERVEESPRINKFEGLYWPHVAIDPTAYNLCSSPAKVE